MTKKNTQFSLLDHIDSVICIFSHILLQNFLRTKQKTNNSIPSAPQKTKIYVNPKKKPITQEAFEIEATNEKKVKNE